MKDYFNIDLYVNNKRIATSDPFTTSRELMIICHKFAKKIEHIKKYSCCDVEFFCNGKYQSSCVIVKKDSHFTNVCELITALYYYCGFDIYVEE